MIPTIRRVWSTFRLVGLALVLLWKARPGYRNLYRGVIMLEEGEETKIVPLDLVDLQTSHIYRVLPPMGFPEVEIHTLSSGEVHVVRADNSLGCTHTGIFEVWGRVAFWSSLKKAFLKGK